jgi:hypothetical protein
MNALPLRFTGAGLAALLALGGCAVAPTTPSVMVLPGTQKSPAQFQADAGVCQQRAQALLAPQAEVANNQAAATALVGTAIGAAVGALFGSGYYNPNSSIAWGAGSGLLVGSTLGAGNSQASSYGLQQRFDIAYMQCMYQFGNQIPGQTARVVRRAAPPLPPPNQSAPRGYSPPAGSAPNYPPPNTPPPIGVPPA